MEDVVKALIEQNAELTKTIIELTKTIAELRKPAEVEPVVMAAERQFPLYMPETEEDARALNRAGVIDKEQLQEVLSELEFFNSDITVPS